MPLIAALVARWVWRFHLRALRLIGPGVAALAGFPASTAEVVSVLVADDPVLVGLRHESTFRAAESTLVLSLDGHGSVEIARLQHWQASGAPLLVWRNDADDSVEFCQIHTGAHVRLHMVGGTAVSAPSTR
jgi:hypothetical protein